LICFGQAQRQFNLLHLANFYFQKIYTIKTNYEIHDKELLAIVDVFDQWHHFLKIAQHEIIMYSDHKVSNIS